MKNAYNDTIDQFPEGTEIRDGQLGYKAWRHFPNLDALCSVRRYEDPDKGFPSDTEERVFKYAPNEEGSFEDWDGGLPNVSSYKRKAREGWPEGLSRIKDSVKLLKPPPAVSIRRRRIRSDVGDTLDIHRVYAGRFDIAWERRKRQASAGRRIVRVIVNLAANWRLEPATLVWRGAVATLLVGALEEAGYRCEIIAFNTVSTAYMDDGRPSRKGPVTCFSVTVKRPDQTLSLERLALVLAHPSTLRTAIFAAYSTSKSVPRGSYGSPVHERPSFARDTDVVVDNIWSSTDATRFLNEVAKQYS